MLLDLFNFWAVIALMMIGFYIVIGQGNLVKKVIGLNIFQTSVFIFYISVGKVEGGTAPILIDSADVYSNPLPHVLILTAIVVGIATTALALALIVRIKEAYGTIEETAIQQQEQQQELQQLEAIAKPLHPDTVYSKELHPTQAPRQPQQEHQKQQHAKEQEVREPQC